MSDSVWSHRRHPTRLRCPWDSPGKNTGVGCHFLLQCMKVKSESEVTQSCRTLSDPMNCSPPASSIHGIFQARVLEWGAIAFSKEKVEFLPKTIGPSFFTSIYIKHAQISRNSCEHFWWEIFCFVLIYYISCELVNNLIMRIHSIFSFKFHWMKKAKGKLAMEITGLSRLFFFFFPYFWMYICLTGGFPGGKEYASNAGDTGDTDSIPGSWRSPRGINASTPVFLPGKSHGQRRLVGCSPQGCKELESMQALHQRLQSILCLRTQVLAPVYF